MNEASYFFGKFDLIVKIGDRNKFIWNGLTTDEVLKKREYIWGYFNINEVSSNIGQFIEGYLVKYKDDTREEVVELKTHRLQDQPVPNRVIAKSRFFLHIETGFIAFHPVANINIDQFCRNFSNLFEKAYGSIHIDAEIQLIDNKYDIFKVIKEFDIIQLLSIYLYPPNPRLNPMWRNVGEKLKNLNASAYRERFYSQIPGGMKNIEEDEDIISKIHMSQDGYGEVKITGLQEGQSKTVSSGDNPEKCFAPPDESPTESILSTLISTFTKLIQRTKSED